LFALPGNGIEMILFGLGLFAAAWLLRRSLLLGRRSRDRDVLADVRNELERRQNSEMASMRRLEVHLLDLARQLEGQLATRQQVLEQLIHQADRRIAKLQAATGQIDDSADAWSWGAFVVNMAEAGFSADQIAGCLHMPLSEIRVILDNSNDSSRPSAAA